MAIFTYRDDVDFEEVKRDAESLYETMGSIPCPYFGGEKIAFNAKGIRHLKFKSDEKARPREDQYSRLKLLYLAPKVVKLSRTLQGIRKTRKFESQKAHSRWEWALKDVCFYEFVAVLENVRVKVIIKEVAGGEKHFWSIIPYWRLDPGSHKRILHSGDPDQD
jgi:hypothetical protein